MRWLFTLPVYCLNILIVVTTVAQSSAEFSGVLFNGASDTVTLKVYENVVDKHNELKIRMSNSGFHFRLNLKKPTYISLYDGKNYIDGIIEPGDKVFVKANFRDSLGKPEFEGKGNEKFYYSQFFIPLFAVVRDNILIAKKKNYPVDYLYQLIDSVEQIYTSRLDKYKNLMSNEGYFTLKGNYQAQILRNRYNVLVQLYPEPLSQILSKGIGFSAPYKRRLEALLSFDDRYHNSMGYSREVSTLLNDVYTKQFPHDANNLTKKYEYILSRLPPRLKSPVVSHLLSADIQKRYQKEELDQLISRIFKSPVDSMFLEYIRGIVDHVYGLLDGDKAPDFTLTNSNDQNVTLVDLRGKVVYMDFWFAGCPPCHQQFDSLKRVKEHFKSNEQIIFLNISVDDKMTWKEALIKYNIAGYHVYTNNKPDHPVIKDYKIYGYPTNRLIDRNGKVFKMDPSSNPEELIMQINEAVKFN